MWDFKFNAPHYFNFFRTQKQNTSFEINLSDLNDQWFLQEHLQLTPIKQQLQKHQNMNKIYKSSSQSKQNEFDKDKMERKNQVSQLLDRINQKNAEKKNSQKYRIEKLKRRQINQKWRNSETNIERNDFSFRVKQSENRKSIQSQQHKQRKINVSLKLSKIVEADHKLSKSRSEMIMNPSCNKMNNKIRMPCPYERKIQRDWETKSNKSWYNLSEDSAKKALQSMKKIKQQKISVGKVNKVGSKK